MPRKRIVDPEFWSDEEIGLWSFQARLFYIGLWNFADDEGRLKAHPKLLKAQIFPYDNKVNIDSLKDELKSKVLWYQINGQEYGYIKNFLKYQRIDRPSESKIPVPPESILREFVDGSSNIREQLAPKLSKVKLSKEKLNTYAQTSAKSEPHPKIIFNFQTSSWEGITEADQTAWEEAYPATDPRIELARMREWILANKAKGKKQNYRRFIINWLSRSQDRGGNGGRQDIRASRIGENKHQPTDEEKKRTTLIEIKRQELFEKYSHSLEEARKKGNKDAWEKIQADIKIELGKFAQDLQGVTS